MSKQAAMRDVPSWVMLQRQTVLRREAMIVEWVRSVPRARVPEIDPGSAAGAFALLVCGMLILADRRRVSSARRAPTGGVCG